MYTRENLEKRKKLFSNPEICEAIRAFWHVLDLGKDSIGAICMDDFLIMNIKIQKTLIPGLRINVRDTSSSASCVVIHLYHRHPRPRTAPTHPTNRPTNRPTDRPTDRPTIPNPSHTRTPFRRRSRTGETIARKAVL